MLTGSSMLMEEESPLGGKDLWALVPVTGMETSGNFHLPSPPPPPLGRHLLRAWTAGYWEGSTGQPPMSFMPKKAVLWQVTGIYSPQASSALA